MGMSKKKFEKYDLYQEEFSKIAKTEKAQMLIVLMAFRGMWEFQFFLTVAA